MSGTSSRGLFDIAHMTVGEYASIPLQAM